MKTNPAATGNVATFSIEVNGVAINPAYAVHAVQINNEVNRVPNATITILDGDPASQDFPISDSGDFVPGAKVCIKAGYDNTNQTVFSGIIVKHAIQVTTETGPTLIITCRDEAFKMTLAHNNRSWDNIKASQAIEQVIETYGLKKEVTATSLVHKKLVQYYSTDWDFMVATAQANGMIVMVNEGTVSVLPPETVLTPELSLTYGNNIFSFEMEMDAGHVFAVAKASSWDMKTQQVQQAEAATQGLKNIPGNLSAPKLAAVGGSQVMNLQTTAPVETAELQVQANAGIKQSAYSMMKGRVTFQGSALAKPAHALELNGVGNRFNGTIFISGIEHRLSDGNWITEAQLGFSFNEASTKTAATGLVNGVAGLQNAIVKQLDKDPDGDLRVLVTIPLLNNETLWARLATFYAGNKAGAFFFPEVGDEVILGFLNEDAQYPVILGSVYSRKNAAPFTPDATNSLKAFVSRSQLKIELDDVKKTLSLTTPGGNKAVLSDDAKTITLADVNGNKIAMSSAGISIESVGNLTLKANQNVNLQAAVGINAAATTNLNLSGLTINGHAQTQLKLTGDTTAELSTSGELVVKGTMVMIN